MANAAAPRTSSVRGGGGSGSNATFNIDVNSGVINAISLADGGSGYIIGNTLSVYGLIEHRFHQRF